MLAEEKPDQTWNRRMDLEDCEMTRIIVDDVLRMRFHNFAEAFELCDESGRVLARVIPQLDPAQYDLEPQITQEEIRRRRQSSERTYSTAEVLAHLETL